MRGLVGPDPRQTGWNSSICFSQTSFSKHSMQTLSFWYCRGTTFIQVSWGTLNLRVFSDAHRPLMERCATTRELLWSLSFMVPHTITYPKTWGKGFVGKPTIGSCPNRAQRAYQTILVPVRRLSCIGGWQDMVMVQQSKRLPSIQGKSHSRESDLPKTVHQRRRA